MTGNPLEALPAFTDDHVALALAPLLSDDVAYTPGVGWMVYEGNVWTPSLEGVSARAVLAGELRRLVVPILATAGAQTARQIVGLLSVSRQDRLMRALETVLTVSVDEWDGHPHLLNTPSGVVDLRTGDVLPHDRALRLTRSTSVGYVPGATSEAWERALECQPSVDERRWLQGYLGSGCWGHQRGDQLALLTGGGANGKSTVTGAVLAALGTYAAMVDRSVILGDAHGEHRMALRGLRFGLIEELADGHRLNMAEIKGLHGTATMVGRHLYKPAVTFPVQFNLAVTTNHKPQVPDTDHGAWRRLVRLDFGRKYEGAELDPTLRPHCATDVETQEAVLAWLIEGAMAPIPAPTKAMAAQLDDWREDTDTIASFIRDHVHAEPGTFTSHGALYEAFCQYAESQGLKQWAMRTFMQRWRGHPYVEAMRLDDTRTKKARGFTGLRIEPVAAEVEPWRE